MSIPPFVAMPSYPMPSSVPFTFTTARSLLDYLEELRSKVNELGEIYVGLGQAYNGLVNDANEAISTALTTIQGLTANYDGQLTDMQGLLDAQMADVNSKIAAMNTAIANANSALSTAQTMQTNYNTANAAFNTTAANLNARMTTIDNTMTNTVKNGEGGVYVSHYGAVGDDNTDDTVSINNAIQAAGVGGRVIFDDKKYKHTGLTQLQSQEWLGSATPYTTDLNTTVLHYVGNGVGIVHGQGGTFEKMIFQGPGHNVANTVGISSLLKSSGTFRDIQVRNHALGMDVNQMWYGHFERVWLFQNAKAGKWTYCYNNTFYNCKIHCALPDSTVGNGIDVLGNAMLTFKGGSMEGYQTGFYQSPHSMLTLDSVYMETTVGVDALGVNFRDATDATLNVHNCQVYVTNHRSWIDFSAQSGSTFNASGNKFKGGLAGQNCFVYRHIIPNTGALRMAIWGDNTSDMLSSVTYMADNNVIPNGSIVNPPYGVNNPEIVNLTQRVQSNTWIAPGKRTATVGFPSMTPEWEGAIIWDSVRRKLAVFDGSNWYDTNGNAL